MFLCLFHPFTQPKVLPSGHEPKYICSVERDACSNVQSFLICKYHKRRRRKRSNKTTNIILPQLPQGNGETNALVAEYSHWEHPLLCSGFQRPNDARHFLMLQLRLYPAVTTCLGKSVIVEAWPQMLKRKQLHMCVCLRIDETGIRLTVPGPWVK